VSPDAGPRAVGFVDRETLLQRIEAALVTPERYAVAQFGLDNFRHLNAAAGADIGDSVLHRFGIALAMSFGDREIARLGGDTFGVLLPYDDLDDVVSLVNRALVRVASSDLSVDRSGVRATASAGITLLDRSDLGAGTALLEADLAMAAAKRAGRNRAVVHDARLGTSVSAVHEWASRIRDAIENDGFVLHAQRVRSLRDQIDQWELLVRLPLADGELLPPAQFLPVAEQFGLGRAVDEWVARRAVALLAAEQARGAYLRLEVNIGESSLASGEFAQTLHTELGASGIDPGTLIFEVNGTTAGVNFDDVKVFSAQLRELGCKFAVDNFGVSAGALDQLRVLPLDYVKIDGSFVRHLADCPADQKIVRALSDLAHQLGYQVIAMSVSDDRSVELLDEFGVDFVQGFHIERPYALEEAR
jgi:diguanylate cyclase (GGDEF)-like protein